MAKFGYLYNNLVIYVRIALFIYQQSMIFEHHNTGAFVVDVAISVNTNPMHLHVHSIAEQLPSLMLLSPCSSSAVYGGIPSEFPVELFLQQFEAT